MTSRAGRTRLCYVACPTSLALESANAIQTWTTLRELGRLCPATLALIPRWLREPTRFGEVGARHLPRPALGKLSRVYPSTLWYYAERSLFSAMTAAVVLWELMRRRPVHVVYVRDVICAGCWVALWGPLLGLPVIYEAHELESRSPSRARARWIQPWLERLDRATLSRSAAVVSLTSDFRGLLSERGWRDPGGVRVIPDAFDSDRFGPGERAAARQRLHLEGASELIVYAGMTFAYRGIDRLLEALVKVRSSLPQARLVLVGGRPREIAELRAQASALRVDDAVVWVGPVPQSDVPQYLQAADVLAIPDTVSDVTASPLKLFEYLAAERAVVLPDVPALAEVLPASVGYYFRRGDAGDLARALVEALSDPGRASREAQGRRAVLPYTYEARARRILELADAVADGSRQAARRGSR